MTEKEIRLLQIEQQDIIRKYDALIPKATDTAQVKSYINIINACLNNIKELDNLIEENRNADR